uniref:Chitin-binding type-2 domain-containing protein n=1 Tax=Anopheles maculatus TaxID=74869 RepID=A0A182T0R0_9DIPT
MNKKLCILLVLVVLCSAASAGKSKESSKEKSKEKSKENSGSKENSKENSDESSSTEAPNTEATETTTAPASSDRCAGQPDFTILPSLTTCSNFVTCQGETETAEATCVPSGTIFDAARGVCDYEANVVCTIESESTTDTATSAPEPTENELKGMCKGVIIDMIPHPGNCNKFVICVLGKPNVQSCGKNQVFYSDIKLCAFGDPKKC